MSSASLKKSPFSIFSQIPVTIWAIGFVSLLINSSTVIIFSIFPLYLTGVLGVSLSGLGIIEGLVEATSWFTRLFSGVVSDFLHRRKPLLVGAYTIAAFSRLIFPIASSLSFLVGARAIDRIANGLQASPREALVGDVAPKDLKGASYGLRQTLGLIGSFVGSLALIYLFRMIGTNYTFAFWLALVPSFLAVLIVVLFVKDRVDLKKTKPEKIKPFHLEDIISLPRAYWMVVLLASFFMMSNYSGAFMILQTKAAGLSEADIPFVMVVQNLAAFIFAFPAGWLSDRLGRTQFLAVGFVLVIVSNLLLAKTASLVMVLTGVAIWGMQMGINQSLLTAKIADAAPHHLRGSAFGIYYVLVGLTLFVSNYISGHMSDIYGVQVVFYLSSAIALIALVLLPLIRDQKIKTIG